MESLSAAAAAVAAAEQQQQQQQQLFAKVHLQKGTQITLSDLRLKAHNLQRETKPLHHKLHKSQQRSEKLRGMFDARCTTYFERKKLTKLKDKLLAHIEVATGNLQAAQVDLQAVQTKLTALGKPCAFRLYASCPKGPVNPRALLSITTLKSHTCQAGQVTGWARGQSKHTGITATRAASALVGTTSRGMEKLSGKAAAGLLETVFGGQFTEAFALRASTYAWEQSCGHPVDSFLKLWPWLRALAETDPKTVVTLGTEEMDYSGTAFVNAQTRLGVATQDLDITTLPRHLVTWMFCAPGAGREGAKFLRHHVFSTDGGFGKSHMGGTLLSLVGFDANKQLYPLAFFWGPAEDKKSCTTFFREVHKAFPFLRPDGGGSGGGADGGSSGSSGGGSSSSSSSSSSMEL